MTCPRCGHPNPDAAKFCNECGAALSPGVAPRPRPAGDDLSNAGSGAVAVEGATAAGAGGVAVGGDVHGDVIIHAPLPPPPAGRVEAYLHWLVAQVRAVPLAGVDPKSVSEESRRDLELAAVYVALVTESAADDERGRHAIETERLRLSAIEVLNRHQRLALLGDPGSGKSTFVNFVGLCMAGERLGLADANLSSLAPPPSDEKQPRGRARAWTHGWLLPVRVVLRDFVARGLPKDAGASVNADTLWKFVVAELPEVLADAAPLLREELLTRGGLLLLDGLDEVPEADLRRRQVKAAVEQFAAAFPVRVLVTSRRYAYQRQAWKLTGFAESVLAPFGRHDVREFVERWYRHVGSVRRMSSEDVAGRSAALAQAIERSPRLSELASRPLLLTLMASLHSWRAGTLPEEREALYADAVELPLDQWESQKLRRLADGSVEVAAPSIVEWLDADHGAVRRRGMFAFLFSLRLAPIEFDQAIAATAKGAPYVGEVLDRLFDDVQAVVVLFTGDETVRLREPFRDSAQPDDGRETVQARPNVLFEAGLALGRKPDHTILVQLGPHRPFSDVGGRHVIRFDGSEASRNAIAAALEAAGCPVDRNGRDWLVAGQHEFDEALRL